MLLVDTGVFIAAADRSEPRHVECADLLRTLSDLTVTAPVIPETAWLLEDRLGPDAEVRFLELATSSRIEIVDLVRADYERSINLIADYADLGLGFVDTSVVAVAERLAVSTIATLNHRVGAEYSVVGADQAFRLCVTGRTGNGGRLESCHGCATWARCTRRKQGPSTRDRP